VPDNGAANISDHDKLNGVAERGSVAYSLETSGELRNVVDPVSWVTDGRYDGNTLQLFEDVGQVYELLLARMEFSTVGGDLDEFRKRTAYFKDVAGKRSNHYFLSSVLGKGQIGHSNQYTTHWFYPYKGKFHGQMIKALVNFAGVTPQGTVLDPFLGSGTTLVECATLDIASIGIDINPALCIVSQIKTDCLQIDFPELSKQLQSINPLDIFSYFHGHHILRKPWVLGFETLNRDARDLLDEAWAERLPDGFVKELPFAWRNFLLLCYLHALSDFTYLQHTSKEKTIEAFFLRDLGEYMATIEGTHSIIKNCHIKVKPPRVLFGSALEINLPPNSVDAIVTSPPYSIALDYVRNDEHLLNYLGIDTSVLRQQMLGLKGRRTEKVHLYELDMQKSLKEMQRVLKPGGIAAILLGDVVVDSTRTNFGYKILSWSKQMAFSEAESIRRPILGGYARLRYEYIILLRK
jgi:SAM-dependent methyltransferase